MCKICENIQNMLEERIKAYREQIVKLAFDNPYRQYLIHKQEEAIEILNMIKQMELKDHGRKT